MRSPGSRFLLPAFVTAAALLLYLLRFQYDYAASDQDELIPYLLHRLDPSLLANDWFVQTQAASFNVRTYVVSLLHGLAHVMPVWAAVLVLYLVSWTLIATAIFAFARLITGRRLAAFLTVVAALVLTPQWTLGGNDLVHRMFVPSMLGWGLGLWGVVSFFRRRVGVAALWLGLATWAQALVGLQLAGLCGVLLLADLARDPDGDTRRLRDLGRYAGVFLLTAAPSIAPILVQQLGPPPAAADPADLFYIQAAFRTPHHYLPSAFSEGSIVRFGTLALLGLLAWWWSYARDGSRCTRPLFVSLTTILVLGTLAYLFTEEVPLLFIAELQLFKLTVFAKLIVLCWIAHAVVMLLPAVVVRWGQLADAFPGVLAIGTVVLWSLVLLLLYGELGRPGLDEPSLPGPFQGVEEWAHSATSRDAVFAIPPSVSSFRSRAQRAIVINFKAFPHEDEAMVTWFRRLQGLAPIGWPAVGGSAIIPALDQAYEALTADELHQLAERYGFTYVVRTTPLPADPVYKDAHVQVYRLPLDAPTLHR